MRSSVLSIVLLAAAAGGCSSPSLVGGQDVKVVSASELPPPSTTDLIIEQQSYVLGPLDKLAIDVYGVPELSRAVQVDASGRVAMPLVGSLDVSGKSPESLPR